MFKIDIKISPSVLACDLSCLAEETIKMEKAGADMIHLDVMDGHFVPNITFGAPVIKALKNKSTIIFDAHLMIENPMKYIDDFADAGADIITFHAEAVDNMGEVIAYIKSKGVKAGVSLKPGTSEEEVLPFLNNLDMVLVMTVEPGFGGQKFMADMCPKIRKIRDKANELGKALDIQVDGGIDGETVSLCAEAGANVFVAGSYLFKLDNYREGVDLLKLKGRKHFKS